VLTSRLRFHIIGNMESKDAIAALAALAQETRLAIFRLLVECGPQGLPVGRIGERLRIPPATLSFHLKELNHAKLVTSRHEGRFIRCSANFTTMNDLIGFLTENCCGGNLEECSPACSATPTHVSTQGVSDETLSRTRRHRKSA
jgi:ArsR family transcriptional regulator, arsenate/arsenite/antimonite-responsive transcriptional repressor